MFKKAEHQTGLADCEACGDDGTVYSRYGWQWTLCNRCRKAIEWWESK